MSPSEEQLRRALSEGEGTGPDVDTVLVRAAAFRRERRTKILAAAAVVAVVAGVGVGIGFAANRPGGRHAVASNKEASADNANNAGGTVKGGAGGSYSVPSQGGPSAPAASAAFPCPATLPSVHLSTSVDSKQAFFSAHQPIVSVTVCGYLGTGGVVLDPASGAPVSREFTNASATAITSAIASASTQPQGLSCGAVPANGLAHLVVQARYSTGDAAPLVEIGLGCDSKVTNGAVTRYAWQQPHVLDGFLGQLGAAAEHQAFVPSMGGAQPAPSTS